MFSSAPSCFFFFSILCQPKPRTWYRLLSERLTVPPLGSGRDNTKLDRKTCWQSWLNEKWNSSCYTEKLLIPTQTRGTDVNILVNIKHWQPSDAMWDCRPLECWLQLDGTCCLHCTELSVAAILHSFIISAPNVCGESYKNFSMRMSQTTVVFSFSCRLTCFLLSKCEILHPGQNIATSKYGVLSYKTQAG